MISGVAKVVLDVEDQDRALDFWTTAMGFELVQDTPYGDERWLEVRSPDKGVILVLGRTSAGPGNRDAVPDMLPTSNVMFYCDDVRRTFEELSGAECSSRSHPLSNRSAGGRCSRTVRATDSRSVRVAHELVRRPTNGRRRRIDCSYSCGSGRSASTCRLLPTASVQVASPSARRVPFRWPVRTAMAIP